jgi:hypothetical protein
MFVVVLSTPHRERGKNPSVHQSKGLLVSCHMSKILHVAFLTRKNPPFESMAKGIPCAALVENGSL